MQSTKGKINFLDVLKGALYAAIAGILVVLIQWLSNGQFPLDWPSWKPVLLTALGTLLARILAGFFTNSTGQLFKPEPAPMPDLNKDDLQNKPADKSTP